ncbi:prepilin peptidase [Patescibacteria group bacterium]|nr:prepilin peptidase [Patescibacteria group bacterium]
MFSLATLGLSTLVLSIIAFGFGAIVGSFLNVVIYRLHTGRSLQGRSHCLSCATPLRVWELIPLFSYLGLRGRCSHCRSRFTARYFGVELLTALLFVLTMLYFATDVVLVGIFLFVMSLLVVVFVYDLRHMIIPDEYVVALTLAALGREFYSAVVVLGTWVPFLYSAFAASTGALFFYALWFMSGGKWIGFGDVKLAWPLGLLLGSGGVFSMVVFSFWIGAGISLLLLALMKLSARSGGKPFLPFGLGTLTMKSAVPFAPFLIVSFLTVLFFQVDVLALLSYDFFL